mmetsp:Transcript_19867/g.61617  ORF Transcript_19867/g.61617 Transcript_19867/m.61617 type:complete len:358 (-) Transcript_19867:87-1160(-)
MALYIDKHRPTALQTFEVHADTASHLRQLVASGDMPHTLFYGPPGAGKKTLVSALLREMYGAGTTKLKVEQKAWKIEIPDRASKVEVDLVTVSSNYHVELNPSSAGLKDRYVVQEVLKEMARSRPIDATGKKGFKMVVLNEVDKLSKVAQQSLRRTMEKYSAACRLVLVCNSASKVLEAVRSRCLCVRVGLPRHAQVVDLLQAVAKRERLDLPPVFAERLARASGRSMRRALLSLEAARVQQYPFAENQQVDAPDWEQYIATIASDILNTQSPARLFAVRSSVFDLLVNCIPPSLILRTLAAELMKKLDTDIKHEVAHWAAFYEHRLTMGSKAIFHIEAFVARFMSIYKNYLMEMMF